MDSLENTKSQLGPEILSIWCSGLYGKVWAVTPCVMDLEPPPMSWVVLRPTHQVMWQLYRLST